MWSCEWVKFWGICKNRDVAIFTYVCHYWLCKLFPYKATSKRNGGWNPAGAPLPWDLCSFEVLASVFLTEELIHLPQGGAILQFLYLFCEAQRSSEVLVHYVLQTHILLIVECPVSNLRVWCGRSSHLLNEWMNDSKWHGKIHISSVLLMVSCVDDDVLVCQSCYNKI